MSQGTTLSRHGNSSVRNSCPEVSPYLLPPFAPHPIGGGETSRHLYRREKLPPVQPLYTKFEYKPYRPPRVDQTYVDRVAFYDRQDRDYKKQLAERYKKEYPMTCYTEDQSWRVLDTLKKTKRMQQEQNMERARRKK